jgi:hypothetical protein
VRQQLSTFVKGDIYSKYLQGLVFVGVLAAGALYWLFCHVSIVAMWLCVARELPTDVSYACAAAVDAAYSGDWVRIQAIQPETEASLKQALPLLGAFHIFCAAVSGVAASRAGRPWQWPTAKAALVGGLAMFEQLLQLDD